MPCRRFLSITWLFLFIGSIAKYLKGAFWNVIKRKHWYDGSMQSTMWAEGTPPCNSTEKKTKTILNFPTGSSKWLEFSGMTSYTYSFISLITCRVYFFATSLRFLHDISSAKQNFLVACYEFDLSSRMKRKVFLDLYLTWKLSPMLQNIAVCSQW